MPTKTSMQRKIFWSRKVEETENLHEACLEWGCVTNLINKIGDIEERIEGHWDDLLNMIADVVDKEGKNTPEKVFFDMYAFFFHLYYRLRANPTKRPFNQVDKTIIAGREVYRIINYDYNTFKWAKSEGFIDGVSNDCIDLPADKLTDNQRRAFDRRLGDNK